jgi:hypothetical protein
MTTFVSHRTAAVPETIRYTEIAARRRGDGYWFTIRGRLGMLGISYAGVSKV